MATFTIAKGSGEKLIKTYSNKDAICFEEYNYFLNDNFPDDYLTFSKDGNNFVVERYIAGINDSSVVLKDYFVRKTKTVLNTINNQSIIGNVMIDIDGSGKIYGTFLDDIITGSNGNDIVYSSDGADDVYAKAGDDIIYTSTQGSNVEAGTGNDIIYVKKSSEDYENGFIFNAGDGSDTIYNSSCYDYIMFRDVDPEKVSYIREGNNLIIQSGEIETDSVKLVDWFSQRKNSRVNYVSFYGQSFLDVDLNDFIIQSFSKNEEMSGKLEETRIFHTGASGSKLVVSGSNKDVIYVNNFSNTAVRINDNTAFQSVRFNDTNSNSFMEEYHELTLNDELHINNSRNGEGPFIFFDVATDELNPPEKYGYLGGYSPNLYITKNSNIMNFIMKENTPGYISVENWFEGRESLENEKVSDGRGVIENIYYNGGKLSQSEYIERVTNDVRKILNDINSISKNYYESAMDVLLRGTKAEKQAIIECYTKENVHITLTDKSEATTFYGSVGNDFVTVADNYKVNGGKGDDKLYRGDGATDYILNGEDGNDILQGGENVIVKGGKGDNVIIIDGSSTNTVVTQGSGKDYIHFVDDAFDDEYAKYTKDGNDLIINGNSGSQTTLKDYFKYGAKSSIKGVIDNTSNISDTIYDSNYASEIKDSVIKASGSLSAVLTKENVQIVHTKGTIENISAKYSGTDYNDVIDAKNIELYKTVKENGIKIQKEREGFDKGYSINGGKGDDTIRGTAYSDTITGGIGENIIKYASGDGNDIINLTKGENFILELIGDVDIDNVGFEFVNKNKDLRIYADSENKEEYITIKNFVAKDVTNNGDLKKGLEDESSVLLLINDVYYDLREAIGFDDNYFYKINAQKNYTGSWLSEEITTSIEEPLGKNNKGLTINAAGGDDKITGSLFNDTITAGAGENTINYIQGSGQDVINLTKGEILYLEIYNLNEMSISFEDLIFTAAKNKKDLEITIKNDEESKITLKNYYATETGATVYISGADISSIDYSVFGAGDEYFENNSKFTGSALSDIVDATNAQEGKKGAGVIINTGAGDDKITGSLFNDTITGGKGENVIYYTHGAGQDIINLTKGETLRLWIDSDELLLNPAKNKKDLEITIDGDEESKITIKNYYSKETGATVYINDADITTIECAKFWVGEEYFLTNSKYTGSALSDIVDASSAPSGKKGAGVIINTGAGDDKIIGSMFNDSINGGNGDDVIYTSGIQYHDMYFRPGTDIDTVKAGNGDDTIYLGSEKVTAYGEAGDDNYFVKAKNAIIIDSDGSDTYKLEGESLVKITDKKGSDTYDIDSACQLKVEIEDLNGDDTYNIGAVDYLEINEKNGDDTYNIGPVDYLEIEDKNGNDTYNISTLTSSYIEIEDKNGTDNIVLENVEKENVTLLFDVKVNAKTGKIVASSVKDLVILHDNKVNELLSILRNPNSQNWAPVTVVEDYFASSSFKIETIVDKDGNCVNTEDIEHLREEVANWLLDKQYTSAIEVLTNPIDNGHVQELLNIYQDLQWQTGA